MGNQYLGEEFLAMRRKYASVFLAIILFTFIAQIFIQYSIWVKTDHSKVINMAGRQRMLSQRIANLAQMTSRTQDLSELKLTFETLSQSHKTLKAGDKKVGVPKAFNQEILQDYKQLDPIIDALREEIECLELDCQTKDQAILKIVSLSETWLPQMDQIVKRSENYATSELKTLSLIELGMFLSILFFMAFEFFGMLLPYQKQVSVEKQRMVHTSQLATLGELSAGLAHEINNPLAVIQSGALAIDFLKLEDPRVDELTSKIKNSVNRVVRIVDSLRKFSRKSENSDIAKQKLSQLIQESVHLVARKSERHKVLISVECDESAEVYCDEIQLGQVFTNLVSNAIDAVKEHENPWVKIFTEQRDGYTKVVFMDSGNGIGGDVAEKVFNPFFTTKPVKKGTGLGLSLSKGLVESNGGKIWYEIKNGHTAFVVSLANNLQQDDVA